MTITQRVRRQMLDGDAEDAALIRLDPHPAHASKAVAASENDRNGGNGGEGGGEQSDTRAGQAWSAAEHERFLEALVMYPSGPWKLVAAHVGSRTTRQTMTHAQKYRQKIERQRRRQSQQAAGGAKQQQQQQTPLQADGPSDDAKRAQAAMVALQQAVSVARDDRRSDKQTDKDAKEAHGKSDDKTSDQQQNERALPSKVSQAVVSLIQLAEPTDARKTNSSK